MKWYKYDIRDLSKTEYDKWFSLMNEEKQRKVTRLRSEDDKKRTVAGEMLARNTIAQRCNVSAESIVFGKNKNGKPFTENLDVQFNISHSGDIVVCAVDERPVGIDVEKIRPVNLKIAKRVYTQDEILYLFDGKNFTENHDSATIERFFELWTAKEAYLKYLGCGIIDNLNSLSVDRKNIYTEKDENYIISIYTEK